MAIIFNTRFATPLNTDFPESAPHSTTNYKLISGRGIDSGNALTCSFGPVKRTIAAYGGSNYSNLTSRIQWGFAGTFPDAISGISKMPGLKIFVWDDPISNISSISSSFYARLSARSDGKISLFFDDGDNFVGFSSATSVLTYNGQMYGIQVTFAFTGHSSVTYNVIVNNISVISGTYNNPAGVMDIIGCGSLTCWGWSLPYCIERAFITRFEAQVFHQPAGLNGETSIAEIQIEDTVNVISYPPCNAIPATFVDPCAPGTGGGSGGGEDGEDLGGIYFINPTKATKRDTYFNDGTGVGTIERKIPNPTIRTALIGD